MNADLSVSVVLYKTPESDIASLLLSHFNSSVAINLHFIDNSPEDSLRRYFEAYDVRYDHYPNNPGYGAGHNIAIRESLRNNIKYHLVLNADIDFGSGCLETLISEMEKRPRLGLCVTKLLTRDGKIEYACKLLPHPSDLAVRLPIISRFVHASSTYDLRFTNYDAPMWSPYYSGSFLFFRTDVFREIGLFDERFFMYPEDIDISRRVLSRFESQFLPHAEATHTHAAASKKSIRMFYIHMVNMIKYFNKWGWFKDEDRERLNQECLRQFSERL